MKKEKIKQEVLDRITDKPDDLWSMVSETNETSLRHEMQIQFLKYTVVAVLFLLLGIAIGILLVITIGIVEPQPA